MGNDPLTDKLDSITKSIDNARLKAKKAYADSTYGKFHTDASVLSKFLFNLTRASFWIYIHILEPFWRWTIFKPARWILWKYITLWNKVTYKKDEYGTLRFIKMRGVAIVLTTLFVLYSAPTWGQFLFDATILYPLTSQTHIVYTKGITEISVDGDIYSTGGCDTVPNCSSQDTSAYRIRPLLFNHVWSMIHHFQWSDPFNLFYPDYIARAIPQETAACKVHTWGWRQKFMGNMLYRTWDLYADIVEVYSCEILGSKKG